MYKSMVPSTFTLIYLLSDVLMSVGPLWSLQVDESGEGGGGMSGFTSQDFTSIFTSGLGSL